jgi:O-antigen ligase
MNRITAGEHTFPQDPSVLRVLEYAFLALLAVRSFSEAFPELMLPVGPLPFTLSALVMLLMSGIGLLYLSLLWFRRDWAVDRLGLYFLAWVLSLAPWVYVAAAEWGLPGLSGAREWVRLLLLVLLYLVVREIARRRGPERVIHTCLLALPVPLVLTYYQLLVAPQARAFATTVHPNNLAAFYVVMIALIVWKLVKPDQSLRARLAWSALLLVALFAIIAPISSNAWLMLAVFLVALALVINERTLRLTALAIGVGFLIVFLGLFFSGHQRVQAEVWQVVSLFGVEVPGWKGGTGTIGFRLEMWRKLSGIWAQHPLRGYGLNSVLLLNPVVGKAAHGDYVRYLVEAGIFGLIFFILFQAAVGRELFRLARETPVSYRWLAGIGFALFTAWVAGSIGDNLIAYTVFHVYFWSLLACVSAVSSSRIYPVHEASTHPIPKP